MNKSWDRYIKARKDILKDCCINCQSKKIKDVSNIKYGTNNPSQTKEVIQKIKNTFQEKYGVDNIMCLPETYQKILKTTESNYGNKYILATKYGREKVQNTNLKKYGSKNFFNSSYYMNKMYSEGKVASSDAQRYLHNIIGGKLNYPFSKSYLDIAFPDEKIYVEGDFSGHWLSIELGSISEKEFKNKERNRWNFLKSKGWKEIRIVSKKDKLPNKEKIMEMIIFAKQYFTDNLRWIRFDIDNSKIINQSGEINFDYGNLFSLKHNKNKLDERENKNV